MRREGRILLGGLEDEGVAAGQATGNIQSGTIGEVERGDAGQTPTGCIME
jgi:hypothetical protein